MTYCIDVFINMVPYMFLFDLEITQLVYMHIYSRCMLFLGFKEKNKNKRTENSRMLQDTCLR